MSAELPDTMRSAALKVAEEAVAPTMADAVRVLEKVFGYKSFRSHQASIIETVIGGGDALVLMPTGGGKSLCYQVPALVRPGTGVVVSPLIALMQDQVDTLTEAGVSAAFLNSTLDWKAQGEVERRYLSGALDLLYVAPERLVQERTLELIASSPVALFAIDEAHCVSQWGHDFRPEYRQLRVLAERFPGVPRIALTATADERTREEIAAELALHNAQRYVASFDRPNIRYTIAEMGGVSAREKLWQFIASDHATSAGIVYCLSRKSVEETAAWLTRKGRTALAYHAGLTPEVRAGVQSRFVKEDGVIVVATIAFGMGIDKPDVRFVAHLNLPKSLESYYQETGRGGRDGEPADAWMAYGLQDVITQRQWIEQSDGSEAFKKTMRGKLDALVGLCELPSCRRQPLLAYFGETLAEPCGNCDNCLEPPATIDGTVAAQKALSAVYRTGERYGVGYLIDVLTGKPDDRILRNGHDKLKVFGLGSELDAAGWRALYRQLVAGGHLAPDGDGYGTLQLTDRARPVLKGEEKVRMRVAQPRKGKERKERRGKAERVAAKDEALFTALKALRSRLAAEGNVPPYVIFHDKTLIELSARRPGNEAELSEIAGLGTRKIARYGKALVELIATFKPHPLLDNKLSATVNQTLALHLQGLDAERIAAQRGLEMTTVHGHFAEAIEVGLIEARTVLALDEAQIDEILAVFEDLHTVDTGKLGPAHARLDGRYDYGILKCLLAELA